MKTIVIAACMGIWATLAMAHSPLQKTTPDNAAVVADAPSELVMAFKGGIRLTRVTMTKAEEDGIGLDLSEHSGFVSDYTLPLPQIGSGTYLIEWRGLGEDGHALNGAFGFTVE